ncbi:MAG: hypothetical protein K2M89_07085 [Clostridiales bacterium]|nr:hypothetical protein [Clostridiales bacterium]
MNEIYKSICEKSNGKYSGLRFPCVTFGGNVAEVTVVCKKSDKALVDGNIGELTAIIQDACGFHTPVKLKIKDDAITAAALRIAVVRFTEKFNYVSSMSHGITAESEPSFKVKLKMHSAMHELAKDDYLPRLKEFLQNNYVEDIAVDVEVVDYDSSGTAHALEQGTKKEYVIISAQPYIGDFKPDKARAISALTANEYNVAVCGILAMQTEFTSKGGRPYERFLIYDGDLSLQCRYMPNGGKSIVNAAELTNKPVCLLGNVEYDGMRNEASMAVKEISLCTAEGLTPPPPLKAEPKSYGLIFPQSYEVLVQSSMFDGNLDIPSSLKGDFVVFDFETTGLSVIHDRPTELGAVKISDGKLKASFSSLIDPRREIPPEVVEKTGITNDMVKGQPLFEDILPDFYKFTYGCSLIGHNIAFDFPFLLRGGNRSGWAFGNRRTFDTMGIAPRAIPGIQRLSLDNVLESLGLSNDNAHRALSDAAATAKAFIAMKKLLAKQ